MIYSHFSKNYVLRWLLVFFLIVNIEVLYDMSGKLNDLKLDDYNDIK